MRIGCRVVGASGFLDVDRCDTCDLQFGTAPLLERGAPQS